MGVLLVLVALVVAVAWLKWVGALEGIADQVKDRLAVVYPSRPLSRRALPRKLLRAAARTVTVGVSGTALLPTRIEIAVNPADVEQFADALDWLGRDVATALRKEAEAKAWMVPDGPQVVIVPDPERPLRMPRASGQIGALSPDDLRALEHPGDAAGEPPAGGSDTVGADDGGAGAGDGPPDYRAGPVPTDWTGSAVTRAEAAPPAPAGSGGGQATRRYGQGNEVPDGAGAAGARPAGGRTAARATGRAVPGAPADAAGRTAATVPVAVGTLHLRLVSGQAAEADLSAVLAPAQTPLVLGRSRQCDLRVRDRHASARHCSFALGPEAGTLTVEDLGSTNGTFVGGHRIRRTTLRSGDTVHIGDSSWRVELDGITSTG